MTGDMGEMGTTNRRKKGNKVSSGQCFKEAEKTREKVGAEVVKEVEVKEEKMTREYRRGACRKACDTL